MEIDPSRTGSEIILLILFHHHLNSLTQPAVPWHHSKSIRVAHRIVFLSLPVRMNVLFVDGELSSLSESLRASIDTTHERFLTSVGVLVLF
jgi:hypothetical protein